MRRHAWWVRAPVLVVLSMALLGACSSDDGDDAATTASVAPSEVTSSTRSGGAAGGDGGGDGEASGDTEALCTRLREAGDDDVDLDDADEREAFQALVESAPEELQQPLQVLDDAVRRVGDVDRAEVAASLQAVERWGVENCDLPAGFLDDDDLDDLDGPGDLDDLDDRDDLDDLDDLDDGDDPDDRDDDLDDRDD